jgi:hypothetical protein
VQKYSHLATNGFLVDRAADEKEISVQPSRKAPVIKCDECGGIFNRSYLSSHKRLSHGKTDEAKAVETIVALYLKLPSRMKRSVLQRLTSAFGDDGKGESQL